MSRGTMYFTAAILLLVPAWFIYWNKVNDRALKLHGTRKGTILTWLYFLVGLGFPLAFVAAGIFSCAHPSILPLATK